MRGNPQDASSSDSGQGVLGVVGSLDLEVLPVTDSLLFASQAEPKRSLLHKSPLRHGLTLTEEDLPCLATGGGFHRQRVVGVQNRHVFRHLIQEDTSLCRKVPGQVRIPVQMVRRDIQEESHLGTEGVDGFQLEARDLGNQPTLFGKPERHVTQGGPDVPGNNRFPSCMFDHQPE